MATHSTWLVQALTKINYYWKIEYHLRFVLPPLISCNQTFCFFRNTLLTWIPPTSADFLGMAHADVNLAVTHRTHNNNKGRTQFQYVQGELLNHQSKAHSFYRLQIHMNPLVKSSLNHSSASKSLQSANPILKTVYDIAAATHCSLSNKSRVSASVSISALSGKPWLSWDRWGGGPAIQWCHSQIQGNHEDSGV